LTLPPGLIVERTDFVSVPVTDMERAKRFYGETLGLPEIEHPEQGFPEYQLGENVSLYLLQMEKIGSAFTAPHTAHIALRVPDVAAAQKELEARGVEFGGAPFDTGVCHMAFFRDPDGNHLMLHRRYASRD
jgi:catechol 2,3-dioxygenase-like lactoylglutathione lyase family enzyme